MSKSKDKKLKKLKKQHVWPYILGIFLVLIIFLILEISISSFFVINLAYDKLQTGYDNSEKITGIIGENWDETNPEAMDEICSYILEVMQNVGGICITDTENNILFQKGDSEPNWEGYIEELSQDDVRFLLSDDSSNFVYFSEDDIYIQMDVIFDDNTMDGMVDDMMSDLTPESITKENRITNVDFWYQMTTPDGKYTVCVENTVPIKVSELMYTVLLIGVIAVFAIILIIYYIVSMLSLIFERRKLSRILATDVVTGGNNLQFFVKKGKHILKKNSKNNYAVVIIRMEKYRNFCSCYGVKEGEELLENFYLALQKALSRNELLAHGEKADFALLLTYKDENELTARLNILVDKLNNVKSAQKKYFSVGIYRVEENRSGIDAMFNCAGVAISSLSEDNENRMVWFNDEMQREQLWVRKVENDMESALTNREFQVYLQPKYSTKEEVLSGAEALVRWIHPTEGFVAPYRFIPIFEKNGFVIQLDDYMITEVARQQAKWLSEGKKIVPISVNVSRVHFVREDLAEHICRLVDQFNVPHEYIELELTESAFFDDKGVLLNTIKKLKEYGFEISMDDFGAGYSSLNSLKELPLDVLKLDAGFFRQEDKTGRGKLIVGDTISLAKKLDMRIVAEGIETREQVDFLAEMDCDLIQGYYFAKPMPINEFEEKAFI